MKKIKDTKKLDYFIQKTNFKDYFDQDFAPYTELLHFKEGEYLIHEGVASNYLLFMVDGKCRYTSVNEKGDVIIFGASETFKIFGEAASIWGELPNNGVQAIKDTYCLAIDLHKYRDVLLNDVSFLRYVCRILSDRLRIANKTYAYYLSTNTENRLASFIIQNASGNLFKTSLIETADMLGVSYRHLLRVISSFCKKGILKKDKRTYTITNRKELERLINYNYVYFD